MNQAQFTTELNVTPLADGVNWRLNGDLKYTDSRAGEHIVPTGFQTDFASIPSLSRIGLLMGLLGYLLIVLCSPCRLPLLGILGAILQLLAGVVIWLADTFNCDDLLDAAATLHDNGYRRPRYGQTQWVLKFYWDWILFDALRASGQPLWKSALIWLNVTLFGWSAWIQNGRKHA